MRSRSPVTSVAIFAVAAMVAIALVQAAHAQTGGSGDPGHGSCLSIQTIEPTSGLSGFSFDTFMIERASRLMAATSRWQPVNSARLARSTRVRFTVARTSAAH